MVSVAIFTIVMTIALGALLFMSESDRKAQSFKSVINNLNFSMDSMTRSIRTGQVYHCDISQGSVSSPRDCAAPSASSFAFRPADSSSTFVYKLESSNAALCGQPSNRVGCIARSTDGGASYASITSPEVYVDRLDFYVTGSTVGDGFQPKVTILISGEVTVTATQKSALNLQTSVTQRIYDQ